MMSGGQSAGSDVLEVEPLERAGAESTEVRCDFNQMTFEDMTSADLGPS